MGVMGIMGICSKRLSGTKIMVREHETREVKEIKKFKELRKRALLRDTLYGRGAEALSGNKFLREEGC